MPCAGRGAPRARAALLGALLGALLAVAGAPDAPHEDDFIQCMACEANEYVDNVAGSIDFGECKQCPLNSATPGTPATQLSIDNCVCGMGFTEKGDFDLTIAAHTEAGADYKCGQCTAGEYKDVVGDGPCEACPDPGGQMTSVDPFTSKFVHCLCNPGYYRVGDVCEPCAAGTYRETASNEVCKACPAGSYCPEGSTDHIPCPEPSTSPASSGVSTECACAAGYFNDDSGLPSSPRLCKECAAGTFQTAADQPSCEECAQGKYNTLTAQISDTCVDCQAVPASASTPGTGADRRGECFCVAGFAGELTDAGVETCDACAAGEYRDQAAVDTSNYLCTDCPTESYNEATGSTAEAACVACTAVNGATRETGPGTGFAEAQACKCPAGQYDTGGESHLSTSERPCAVCLAGKYSTRIDTKACLLCVAGKKGVTPQQTLETDACSDCVAGKFNTVDGATECEFCDSDLDASRKAQYQDQSGKTECTDCTANSGHTLDGTGALAYEAASCECNAGYFGSGDTQCEACAPGTYRVGRASAVLCDGCGANADSPAASAERSACTCTAGFLSAPANGDCLIGSSHGTPDTDCSHLSDHATIGDVDVRVCKQCPADQYCHPDLTAFAVTGSPLGARACRADSSSPAGSDNVLACLCDGGYYYEEAGNTKANMPPHACSVCPAPSGDPKHGFYCPPDNDDKQQCGDHTATGPSDNPGMGHTDHSTSEACKCLSGFWRNCVPDDDCCEAAAEADGSCVETGYCQHNDAAAQAAGGPVKEPCNRYKANGDPLDSYWTAACVQCLADDVCEYGESMQHCPDYSAAGAGTSDFEDCKCGAGFEKVDAP